MGNHRNDILASYYDIFNENNKSQRIKFFLDPLMQFLWSKFSEKHANNILAKVDTDPDKRQAFFKEIEEMENITGFKILPEQY